MPFTITISGGGSGLLDWLELVATAAAATFAILAFINTRAANYAQFHRPKLRVRCFVPDAGSIGSRDVRGTFSIVNEGNSTATIKSSRCDVFFSAYPPSRIPSVWKGDVLPIDTTIERGGERLPSFPGGLQSTMPPRPEGPHNVYLVGWVSYEDKYGVERHLGFARCWNPATQRFEPMNDFDLDFSQ